MPSLFGKQITQYNTRKRIVLCDGSRASGKTIGVCHKVMRHLTETPGAQVGAFATSIKAAKDCGSWNLLHKTIIPEWQAADLRAQDGSVIDYTSTDFEGIKGPKRDSNTRTEYFTWRNIYGGEGECALFSIHAINEIAAIVKQKSFSMVWLMELSTWKSIDVMYYTLPALRMKHLMPFDGTDQNYHQWIADTNPDEEEGNQSWFYKFFYIMRNNPPLGGTPDEVRKRQWLAETEVIWMHHRDNPHISDQLRNDLEFACGGDQGLLDSHFHGIHGEGGARKEKHFKNFFIKTRHVVGGGPDEGDQIDVSPGTSTLFAGWDLGSTNHAATILEQTLRRVNDREIHGWNILDELVVIGGHVTLEDFTLEFMTKMKALDVLYGREFKWIHWSDDSAINVFRATSGSYDYVEVLAASKNTIHLQGVPKPSGSQRTRVRMCRQLLRLNMLHFSSRCTATIRMMERLQKGEKDFIVRDEHVHPFDSMSYPIFAEGQGEMIEEIFKPQATQKPSGIVSI